MGSFHVKWAKAGHGPSQIILKISAQPDNPFKSYDTLELAW